MYVTASARLRCVQHSPLLPVPRHPAQAPPRWDLFKAALLAKKNLSSDFRTSPHDRRFLDLKKTTGGLNSGRLPGAGDSTIWTKREELREVLTPYCDSMLKPSTLHDCWASCALGLCCTGDLRKDLRCLLRVATQLPPGRQYPKNIQAPPSGSSALLSSFLPNKVRCARDATIQGRFRTRSN